MGLIEHNQVKHIGVKPVGLLGATQKIDMLTQDGVGTKQGYTVPAGKTFYVTSAWLSVATSAAGTGWSSFMIRDAGNVVQAYIFRLLNTVTGLFLLSNPFSPPIEVPAGWDLALWVEDANTIGTAGITGFGE